MSEGFKSMREFQKHYFPKDAEEYPIEMMVSKDEQDLIFNRRQLYRKEEKNES